MIYAHKVIRKKMLFALSLSSSLFGLFSKRQKRVCWGVVVVAAAFLGERKKGRKEGRKEDDKVSKKRQKNVAFFSR